MMFDEEPVRVTKRLLDDMSIQVLQVLNVKLTGMRRIVALPASGKRLA
jgi:hypothetical protein